jgi:hypothetical protein
MFVFLFSASATSAPTCARVEVGNDAPMDILGFFALPEQWVPCSETSLVWSVVAEKDKKMSIFV